MFGNLLQSPHPTTLLWLLEIYVHKEFVRILRVCMIDHHCIGCSIVDPKLKNIGSCDSKLPTIGISSGISILS